MPSQFLVTAGDGDGTEFVTVVPGELGQHGVEADRTAVTLDHGAAQVVVQHDPGDALPSGEGGEIGRAGSSLCGH